MPNSVHPYERLTSDNAALVLVDHQVGLMTGIRDISIGGAQAQCCWPSQSG